MPFAEVRGTRLFFTDDGVGSPPLLFVHGYTCDSDDWIWQLAHFEQRHRVIAVDLRGHGRSSAPPDGYDPAGLADDLAALLDELDCGPVAAVGHSLGALVVSVLTVEHPDQVSAVVAVDPAYLVADEVSEGVRPLVDGVRDGDPVATVQSLLSAAHPPASPPALRTWHLRRVARVPHHVLRQTLAPRPRRASAVHRSALEGRGLGRVGPFAAPGTIERVQPGGRDMARLAPVRRRAPGISRVRGR